jgi:hypothetical protein
VEVRKSNAVDANADPTLRQLRGGVRRQFAGLAGLRRTGVARQLSLFGWPPPGHGFWTGHTIAGVRKRYPGLDVAPWEMAMSEGGG